MPEQTLNRPHYRRTLAITALALAVLLILGIRFGSTRLDLALIAHGISGTLTPEEAPHWYAFHQMRLPRALATALVGGNLALCGAVMQGLFRNPLVDPDIIGVMSDAAFSVTLYIVIGAEAFPALLHWLGDYALPVAAFAGGIAFVGLIVPHIVRGLTGANNRHVLPVSLLFGAALLSLADLIARTIIAPAELPIGILTAAIGAPFLATLVWQRLGKTE